MNTVRKIIIWVSAILFLLLVFAMQEHKAKAFQSKTITLTAENSYFYKFSTKDAGETYGTLQLSTPSASWEVRGKESIVLSLETDGKYAGDIVVYGGKQTLPYSFMLGNLASGKHTLKIYYNMQKSVVKDGEAVLSSVNVTTVNTKDPLYPMYAHSPFLYGREVNNHSDVPLILYCAITKNEKGVHYKYVIVFSNEDGGTGVYAPALMAQYGRTTDIEWVYAFAQRSDGTVSEEKFQAAGHETDLFTGKKEGAHPVLRVSTTNNNFSQEGESPFYFALVPVIFDDVSKARENVMELFPWSYRIMAEEMAAEKKVEAVCDAETTLLSDAQHYLFIDYNIKNKAGMPTLSLQVQLKNNKRWYSSDHNFGFMFSLHDESARGRTAIELPSGTTSKDITAIAFQGGYGYEIYELHLFFLDANYVPQPPFYEWKGNVHLTSSSHRSEIKLP